MLDGPRLLSLHFRRAAVRLAVLAAFVPVCVFARTGDPAPGEVAYFEREIRPLLAERCYECHSAASKPIHGGLRLDGSTGVLAGGDSGPAVVPGEPDGSLLIEAVRHAGLEMPPAGKLPAEEIARLEEWVRRGAPMPAEATEAAVRPSIDFEEGRRFWSFRPLGNPAPPDVADAAWVRGPVDAFVLAELERNGLRPSAEADRRTLVRRVWFDVVGLPPSSEEVRRFVDDPAPDAYERLVDRLLASPRHGERWGRSWLDLARYSDATASWLGSIGQAWLYRDWVVRAVNEDLPYDDFVRKQLAADQMEEAVPADAAALGFLGLSPVYWKELKLAPEVIKGTVAEEWEERVDAVGRTFLGLTVACARCHDHKYDPIGTADYYALAGVIANTRLADRPVLPEAEYAVVRAARDEVAALRKRAEELEAAKPVPEPAQAEVAELRKRIGEIEKRTPGYDSSVAHGVEDAALVVEADGPDATKLTYKPGEAADLCVQVRGNPANVGPVVPRRFLTVLSGGAPKPFTQGSGRRELAEAIVTDAAPLAARVMVNRVWAHHFGRGLVDTPSDFGSQGSPPTHPELLEHLAARFVAGGWSLKSLHREILLSATYRQGSGISDFGSGNSDLPYTTASAGNGTRGDARPHPGPPPKGAGGRSPQSVDPENRLLWRMNRRRLEVEAWRDAMLAVVGTLDERIGGPAFDLKEADGRRRTVYGRVDRYELDDMLRLYDFPDPLGHSPGRVPTTTPLQQLFVLNGPFLRRQSESLAARVAAEAPGDVTQQVERAYALLFARPPTESETKAAVAFLTGGDTSAPSGEAWRQYAQVLLGGNEFLFVD